MIRLYSNDVALHQHCDQGDYKQPLRSARRDGLDSKDAQGGAAWGNPDSMCSWLPCRDISLLIVEGRDTWHVARLRRRDHTGRPHFRVLLTTVTRHIHVSQPSTDLNLQEMFLSKLFEEVPSFRGWKDHEHHPSPRHQNDDVHTRLSVEFDKVMYNLMSLRYWHTPPSRSQHPQTWCTEPSSCWNPCPQEP